MVRLQQKMAKNAARKTQLQVRILPPLLSYWPRPLFQLIPASPWRIFSSQGNRKPDNSTFFPGRPEPPKPFFVVFLFVCVVEARSVKNFGFFYKYFQKCLLFKNPCITFDTSNKQTNKVMKNETNFHLATKAHFTVCEMPCRMPDYESASGSMYWYAPDGLVRMADHWQGVASCRWTLEGLNVPQTAYGFYACGFVAWSEITDVDQFKGQRATAESASAFIGQTVTYYYPNSSFAPVKKTGKVNGVTEKGIKIGRQVFGFGLVIETI